MKRVALYAGLFYAAIALAGAAGGWDTTSRPADIDKVADALAFRLASDGDEFLPLAEKLVEEVETRGTNQAYIGLLTVAAGIGLLWIAQKMHARARSEGEYGDPVYFLMMAFAGVGGAIAICAGALYAIDGAIQASAPTLCLLEKVLK